MLQFCDSSRFVLILEELTSSSVQNPMNTKNTRSHFILSLLGGILLLTSCQESPENTLQDRLIRDGNLASVQDIHEALTQAEAGSVEALEAWAAKFPQVAVFKEEQSVVMVQEEQKDTTTHSKVSFYHKGEHFSADIDAKYKIAEINVDEENFTLIFTHRNSKEETPQTYDLSFPAKEAKTLIERGLLSSIFDGTTAKKSS